ncbi:hypothetical protein DBR11_25705 [Pedobacter sp. HMWF019]|nr:hypothetical protein DBR11_25705 [Pedobacter sp. HMWF019]
MLKLGDMHNAVWRIPQHKSLTFKLTNTKKAFNTFARLCALICVKKINVAQRGPQGALPQERSGARTPVLEE